MVAHSDEGGTIQIEENLMENAAALLVQLIFNSDERIQSLLKAQGISSPQAAAEFLRPWYQAMLIMVKDAEAFDQGPTA
jgi:hypothetical protein